MDEPWRGPGVRRFMTNPGKSERKGRNGRTDGRTKWRDRTSCPLILRELLNGELGFNDTPRRVPRTSKNLLAQRRESLRGSGIVEQFQRDGERRHVYRLTESGRALGPVI